MAAIVIGRIPLDEVVDAPELAGRMTGGGVAGAGVFEVVEFAGCEAVAVDAPTPPVD